jgi:hypothetical protein
MATLKQCDRCDAVHTFGLSRHIDLPAWVTQGRLGPDEREDDTDRFDLCPVCRAALYAWWHNPQKPEGR